MKALISVLCLCCVAVNSCKSDEVQARKSIEGNWQIESIVTTTGTFNGSTFISEEDIRETGNLGTFDFGENSVTFNFTRNKEVYTRNESWNIETKKINAGFTRANNHTLTIGNAYLFDVMFGDGTKNAEKNADAMSFTKAPTNKQPYGIFISL